MKPLDFSANAVAPVVMRFGAFGDMVILLPMLRYLSEQAGAPVDLISSGGWTRPLLQSQPWVGHVQLVTSRNAPYWLNASQRAVTRYLAQQRDRPLFVCQTDDKARHYAQRAGLPDERVYWAKADPFLPGEHGIERWLRIAHQCYGQTFDPQTTAEYLRQGWLQLPDGAQRDVQDWIAARGWSQRRLILIQAGNKRTMRRGSVARASNNKYWPQEQWAELVRWLLQQHPDAQVLFCGSPEEQEYALGLAQAVDDSRAVAVADDLPIPRLLGLQQQAWGMVSVDTGPAHSAAAMGCPLVTLFGTMDPQQWRPYAAGAPVEIARADPPVDVQSISLADVQSAWQRLCARMD